MPHGPQKYSKTPKILDFPKKLDKLLDINLNS
jgi:hypothetical protein